MVLIIRLGRRRFFLFHGWTILVLQIYSRMDGKKTLAETWFMLGSRVWHSVCNH
jgi:hypothetical protein